MPERSIESFGRYKIQRVLGKGAMGVVYEGLDPRLNRKVAIKTILVGNLDEATARDYSKRFAREAQAVARLNHPNIVQVYDFGEEGDIAYIVMEYVRGKELKSSFDAGERFEIGQVVRLMTELLSAMDFAHNAGVIHRDIKPANVMVDADGHTKLADFGVARISDPDSQTGATQAGTMVGTPAYMSPEQIQGQKIDRRTDIFSAGVILYQFLTGQRPFQGGGAWTMAKKIVHDDPPAPSSLITTVPPGYDQVIYRALAKQPDNRYQSAQQFADALQRVLGGLPAEDLDEDRTDWPRGPATAPPSMKPPARSEEETQRGSEVELEFWRAIKDTDDPEELELYLEEFPQGMYSELARKKMDTLRPPTGRAAEEARQAEALRARQAQEERLRQEAVAKAKREAEEKARREAQERARRDAEEKARREAVAKAKRDAEEKARLEAIARAKREAEEKVRREAEAKAKREAEEKARREAEEKARREAEEKARREAEERARLEAQAKARREAEENARREAEEKTRRESEEKARQEAAERAKRQAEEKARREAEERARLEAEAKARREAEENARREAEEKARREAEEKARREAEANLKREAEEKARREAEEKARREAEAEAKAKSDAEERARQEAEEKARREAEARARREADEKARIEAEAKAKREAAERARREAEEQVRREAEERAARAAEECARREAAQREVRNKALREAEKKALRADAVAKKREAEARERREAEERAASEVEEAARQEAQQAEQAATQKAETRARLEAEAWARREAGEARRAAEAIAAREERDKAQREHEANVKLKVDALLNQQKQLATAGKSPSGGSPSAAPVGKPAGVRGKLTSALFGAFSAAKAPVPRSAYERAEEFELLGQIPEAVKLYMQAANDGSIAAARKLGQIYSNGAGTVEPDAKQSVRWFAVAKALEADGSLGKRNA